MSFRTFATLVLLAVVSPAVSLGQTLLSGSVTDAETREPLPGVHVFLERAGTGVVTGLDGTFELRAPAEPDVLVARFIGYATHRETVTANAALELTIALTPEGIRMKDVIVSATRERQFKSDIAASIGAVDGASIREQNPSHPSDIMGQIAGVWVSQTTGEGHMTSIRQPLSTEPLYLYLENGVPTRSTGFFNHNALYEINVPQSEGIEVMKGPGTALYGSDAIGGVINVTSASAPGSPMLDITAEGGSFGYKRALVSAGNTIGLNGFRVDVNATESDGWRVGTEYARQSATLRWDRRSRSNWLLRTVFSWSNVDQGPAGSAAISEADFRSDPRMNYQPISFRKVQAYRFSSAFETFTAQSLLSITPYVRFNTNDLMPNWSLTFDPTIWETQNWSAGALVKYRYDLDPLRTRVVVGTDLDYSPGERVERRIDPVREGKIFVDWTDQEDLYDYDVRYAQTSPYVHVETSPIEALRLTAGMRLDVMFYDYTNNLSTVTTGSHRRPASTSRSYTHLSPKLGATFQVVPSVNVFASWRHAFRVPSESQLFRQGSISNTIDLEPVKVDNVDLGLRGRVPGIGEYELAAYALRKIDDIVAFTNVDGTRVSVNAGETLHRGLELGVTTAPVAGISVRVGGSLARHTYESWETQIGEDYSGNEVETAPRVLLNAAATWRFPLLEGGLVSLEWNRLGNYWMDAENTSKYEGHDLLNLNANLSVTGDVTVLARISNVTDALYAERATYNAFRGDEFAPGLPRTVHVSVRYALD
jgi:outer membrane receptor protein involved in Fe transport